MNAYVLSAAVGLLVGVIYGVLNVRSPAPPVIALVGLLGILAGEQIPPLVRQWLQRDTRQASWIEQKVRPHMFGQMPGCDKPKAAATAAVTAKAGAQATETHDV
jgi:XapX domain-containing protein